MFVSGFNTLPALSVIQNSDVRLIFPKTVSVGVVVQRLTWTRVPPSSFAWDITQFLCLSFSWLRACIRGMELSRRMALTSFGGNLTRIATGARSVFSRPDWEATEIQAISSSWGVSFSSEAMLLSFLIRSILVWSSPPLLSRGLLSWIGFRLMVSTDDAAWEGAFWPVMLAFTCDGHQSSTAAARCLAFCCFLKALMTTADAFSLSSSLSFPTSLLQPALLSDNLCD